MNEYKDFGFSDKISEYQDSDPLILKLRFIQSLDKDFRNLTMPLYCAWVCYTTMNEKDIIPDLSRLESEGKKQVPIK